MLNAVIPRCWAPEEGSRVLQVAVEIKLPGGTVVSSCRVVPDVARNRGASGDGVVLTERPGSTRPFFEVPNEHAVRGADAQEVIHVDIAALGLGPPLRQKRDGVGDAAGACGRTRARARSHEPGLEREGAGAKAGG